jgi:putative tricarboxylic transport membrane protein
LLNIASQAVDFGLDEVKVAAAVAQSDGQILLSRSKLGWKNLNDLKAACDKEPDARLVAIAYSKTTRIMGEMLVNAGIKCRLVDSDGGADRVAKLLGGFIDAGFTSYDQSKDYIASGEFTALAIVQEERSNVCSTIPTAVEQGYDVVFPTTYYLLMPKDTPANIVDGWNVALKAVSSDPKFIARVPEVCVGLQVRYQTAEEVKPRMEQVYEYAEKYLK